MYSERIAKAGQKLPNWGCQALLIEEKTNLYYLTGQSLSSGAVIVHDQGADLFVDNRYYESCLNHAPCSVHLVEAESLSNFIKQNNIASLGFDSENTTYKRHQELQKYSTALIPLDNPIKFLRMIKDQFEIQTLREAAILGSQGFDFVCSLLREGIKENEVAAELEIFWIRRGSKSLAFDPIIAFGPNSSMPHYRAGNNVLRKGMPVLIDIGVNYRHYHSDMTRVVFYGEPDPKIRAIYTIVEKAQKAALSLCKPGTPIGKLDETARGLIKSEGYGEFFNHGLGHGVGLEIHESPSVRNNPPHSELLLQPGMVITIEPGIYLPGIGGVRIEDTVLITPTGSDNLTMRSTSPLFFQ